MYLSLILQTHSTVYVIQTPKSTFAAALPKPIQNQTTRRSFTLYTYQCIKKIIFFLPVKKVYFTYDINNS